MPVHGTHYTKTHLSKLIRMVEHGHVITITRNQAPVALLLRIGAVPQPRRPGSLRALMTIDAALDDAPALDDETQAQEDGAHAQDETPTPSLTATTPDT